MHPDEIPIDVDLVRRLVASQQPHLAALPLTPLPATGSSNRLFRLGDDWLVRLPRQPGGGQSIAKEQRWLPAMRARLPVALPELVAVGDPDFGYPEPWALLHWLPGVVPRAADARTRPPVLNRKLAADLADVVRALRAIEVDVVAAADPALRNYRGRALAEFDPSLQEHFRRCRAIAGLDLDLDAALEVWQDALRVPGARDAGADRWYHGDLVAENLLLTDGRLSAVLDLGGLGVGDPTVDLHGVWEILDPDAREVFRKRLGVDDAEWVRGRAWALAIALTALSYYWTSMPGRRQDRLAMARAVLADAGRSV